MPRRLDDVVGSDDGKFVLQQTRDFMNNSSLRYASCGVCKAASLFVWGLVFWTLSLPAISFGAEAGQDWQKIDKDLVEQLAKSQRGVGGGQSLSAHMILDLPAAAALSENRDLSLFHQMIVQPDCTIVPVLGYLLVEKHDPDKTFTAACNYILHTKYPPSVFSGIPIQYLHQVPAQSERCTAEFSKLMLEPAGQIFNVELLVSALPDELLVNWWAHRPDNTLIENEAVVAGHLFPKIKTINKDIAKSLHDRLDHYGQVPGMPLYVYLYYGSPSEQELPKALMTILDDQRLSDIAVVGLFRKYRAQAREMDLSASKASKQRVEMVRRMMVQSRGS